MTIERASFYLLGLAVLGSPALMLSALGGAALIGRPLDEPTIRRLGRGVILCGFTAAVGILVLMLAWDTRHVELRLGHWVLLPEEHFHFTFKLVFDRLSVPLVILSFALCGTIGAFANVYLHRELGFGRFFIFFAMFLLGMILATVAGTIETLFAGWELVGLSSALLVSFFHERLGPVKNGLRVWTVYRLSDATLLIAAVALHHVTGEGDFAGLLGAGSWPEGQAALSTGQATFVGLMILIAAAGKSALIPFSGWLPRAMEGPTPSSAVFYGALSVHLGAYLLLRTSPIFEAAWGLSVLMVVLGAATAVFATLTGRVQTDIKSALAFASLTQVGIIVAEIGLGFRYLALAHILGHACLRTLQLLRAPTLLHDYHTLENALGAQMRRPPSWWDRWVPNSVRLAVYRFSVDRGHLDTWLDEYLVLPFLKVFRRFDALERQWTDTLAGRPSRESDQVPSFRETLDELR